jgi:hypothetical protein
MLTSTGLQQAYKAHEIKTDAEGEWLPRRQAAPYLGVSKVTLLDWRKGVPWLPGEKLRTKEFQDANGKHDYYLQSQLDRIIAGRAESWKNPENWARVETLCERFGWGRRTVFVGTGKAARTLTASPVGSCEGYKSRPGTGASSR